MGGASNELRNAICAYLRAEHESTPEDAMTTWAPDSPVYQLAKARIAQFYDVPPWIMLSDFPEPRFSRLRWKLRRVFPRLVWP